MESEPGPLDMMINDPIDAVSYVMKAVHIGSGVPWWGLIPTMALSVRVASLPLIRSHHRNRLQLFRSIGPQLSSLSWPTSPSSIPSWFISRRHILLSAQQGGHFRRNRFLYLHLMGSALHVLSIRNCAMSDPSMASEGILWFTSLSSSDPYLRLPMVASALSLISLGMPPPSFAPTPTKWGYRAAAVASLSLPLVASLFSLPDAVALHLASSAASRLLLKGIPKQSSTSNHIITPTRDSVKDEDKNNNNPRW